MPFELHVVPRHHYRSATIDGAAVLVRGRLGVLPADWAERANAVLDATVADGRRRIVLWQDSDLTVDEAAADLAEWVRVQIETKPSHDWQADARETIRRVALGRYTR